MNQTTRLLVAFCLGCFALFGVESCKKSEPTEITIEEPDAAMKVKVSDVHRIMATANPIDRILWAQLWAKSAAVVRGDATDTQPVFTDTRALRGFQIIAVRIGWRRLGANPQDKYRGLGEAVERAFADTIGLDVKPVTPEVRQAYIDLCNALAWCGAGRG
jgi:hypothetical protein